MFTKGYPPVIYWGFPIATFDYQRACTPSMYIHHSSWWITHILLAVIAYLADYIWLQCVYIYIYIYMYKESINVTGDVQQNLPKVSHFICFFPSWVQNAQGPRASRANWTARVAHHATWRRSATMPPWASWRSAVLGTRGPSLMGFHDGFSLGCNVYVTMELWKITIFYG